MKKFLSVLVCAAAAAVSLAACGGSGGAAETEDAADAGSVQLPNPLVQSSLEEIEKLDGVSIAIPEGADSVTAVRISTVPVIDSVTFDAGGQRYIYRVSKTEVPEDISGMYYDWGEPEGGDVPADATKCFITGEGQGIMLWYRDGHSFSLAMTEGADLMNITGMYQKLDDGTVIS